MLKFGPQKSELRVGIGCWIVGPNWIPSLLPDEPPVCMINRPVPGEHLENQAILPKYLIPRPRILQESAGWSG